MREVAGLDGVGIEILCTWTNQEKQDMPRGVELDEMTLKAAPPVVEA